ncbi:MAG: porphobilinogen synthase [Syntrophomonadaceae bacterium]|nr:porphobilinogen synthase [Syntrophomonadaceae bacterium]
MGFPIYRGRRLRSQAALRAMVAETSLHINDLIYPMFVIHGKDKHLPVTSMPGVYQLSVDRLVNEVKEVKKLGIAAVLLFGIPESKDAEGSSSYQDNGVVQQAIKAIKDCCPELIVVTDVCLCEYTDHGHCGLPDKSGYVDNDATLEILARQALSHVRAGCDIVAPSDMMDGRVGRIRNYLDDNGYIQVPIMAYAAKFASSFYGPFRDAADSTPQFGDRKTYQMDYCNINEALREVAMDIEEGADLVMVKPALAYLDVIKAVKEKFSYPTVAYNVSGEYAMVKAAAEHGWIDEEKVTMEIMTAIKRAGADLIITYAAKDVARYINR